MKVYNYNPEGYLIGVSELDNSDKCQITGEWLIPAMSTDKEPLEPKEGFDVKFNGAEWEYIKILSEEERKIQWLLALEEGEKIEDGNLIKITSPGEFYSWNFDSCEWLFDESKKQAKINEINSKAYYEISLLYPDWKQANITADYLQYPDNEIFKKNFEDMRLYINQIRANADYEVILLG